MMVDISNSHIEVTDTKSKILAYANEMFAKQGFDGVSIRDLAQEADVNVASINYHFKNKLNLFHEIFNYNYHWLDNEIEKLSNKEGTNTESLLLDMWELFNRTSSALVNCFELVLSEHLTADLGDIEFDDDDKPFGPPGEQAILKIITQEVGEDVPFENRDWAVKSLFTNLIHTATFLNTTYLKMRCKDDPQILDPEIKKWHIKELSAAIVARLKSVNS